ncbi:hypothetical protein BpHYR1_019685 [Brachionus plicatilis]|uniref:Uncharacterized protein n=1 Tax=Brachionus plicatilis TaxID=10195 RepID=A0A3M7RH03_BRAPC|nr:hypothetical protein BpHYR1_019685 [Brachionus plicatilis]
MHMFIFQALELSVINSQSLELIAFFRLKGLISANLLSNVTKICLLTFFVINIVFSILKNKTFYMIRRITAFNKRYEK